MKNWLIFGAVALTVLIVFMMYMSYSNREVALRNQIVAVQRDLHNELDLTTKKISQTAQVTEAQMEELRKIIVGHAEARGGSGGSLATLVKEAVPDLSASAQAFTNLQNIIAGARDRFAGSQKLLLDVKREHDNIIDQVPSGWFVGGRGKIVVQIVTSSRVEESFRTGIDDDDSVFKGRR